MFYTFVLSTQHKPEHDSQIISMKTKKGRVHIKRACADMSDAIDYAHTFTRRGIRVEIRPPL